MLTLTSSKIASFQYSILYIGTHTWELRFICRSSYIGYEVLRPHTSATQFFAACEPLLGASCSWLVALRLSGLLAFLFAATSVLGS